MKFAVIVAAVVCADIVTVGVAADTNGVAGVANLNLKQTSGEILRSVGIDGAHAIPFSFDEIATYLTLLVTVTGIVYASIYQRRAQKITLYERRSRTLILWQEVRSLLRNAVDDCTKGSGDETFSPIGFTRNFGEALLANRIIVERYDFHNIPADKDEMVRAVLEKVRDELLLSDTIFTSRRIPKLMDVLNGLVRQVNGYLPDDGVVVCYDWLDDEVKFYDRIRSAVAEMELIAVEMRNEMSITKKWYEVFG